MSTPFHLKIVTPARVVFDGGVSSVTCPGAEGRFQVLHNHAPLLSVLDIGEMEFRDESDASFRFALGGGTAQVLRNEMLILADSAERSDEIDVSRAQSAKSRAEQRLAARAQNIDLERARAALYRAINRLKVARQVP